MFSVLIRYWSVVVSWLRLTRRRTGFPRGQVSARGSCGGPSEPAGQRGVRHMSHGNCRGGGMEKVAAPLQSPRGPAGVNPAAASAGLSRGLGPRAGGWPRIQAAFCDAPRGCRPPSPAAITCWAAAASRPLRSARLGSARPLRPAPPQPRPRHRRRAAPLAAPAASRRAGDRGVGGSGRAVRWDRSENQER